MKIRKINRKSFTVKAVICFMILATLSAAYWVWIRSVRIERAQKAVSQVVEYVQARLASLEKSADVMAAWLDAEGDRVKKEIASSGDGQEYAAQFEIIAQALYDPENMTSLQLMPKGVVRYIYPAEGNENMIGMHVEEKWGLELKEMAGSKQMRIIGPVFVSRQGLMLFFFMPVFYEDGSLWGYTALSMRMPDALLPLALDRLTAQGYDYELRYAVGTDGKKKERITGTVQSIRDAASSSFIVQDTEWVLSVRPENGWISIGGILLSALGALVLALILTWLAELRRANRDETMSQLRSDAKHDKMTGLLNHTASAETIDNALKTEEGGVLLLIDVDNFKTVNDSAGHLSGDEVLVEVANAMRTTFRKHDILGRYGGDEFIVYMIGDISIPDFSVKASQFQRKIRKIPIGDTGSFVTCSIGGARRCVETPTAEALVQRADQALYTSKENGKDRFTIFDDSGSTVLVTPKKDESEMDHDYAISE